MATLHVRNVPDGLYEAVRRCAEREGRSIGAQVIAILEESLVHFEPLRVRGLRQRVRRRSREGPFRHFTQRARRVVVAAQEEARRLGHNYLGTEHILLGLLRVEDGVAARALLSLGVSLDHVRSRVDEIVGRGTGTPAGRLPFTPRAKKVLELALRESLALGHDYIGTEHILLGVLAEGEGVAAKILLEVDVEYARARDTLVGMLAHGGAAAIGEQLFGHVVVEPREEYRAVALEGAADEWSRQLNEAAAEGWDLLDVIAAKGEARAVFRRADAA